MANRQVVTTMTSPPTATTTQSCYQILGYRASVRSNRPDWLALLDRLNYRFINQSICDTPDAVYEAIAYPAAPLWEVTYQGEELAWCESLFDAIGRVEWHLVNEALDRQQQRLVFHAAVLAGSTGSLMVPGGSGIGKTTLALAATLAGLTLYADDIGLIDPVTRCPDPFPRALHVHDDALTRLAALGLAYNPIDKIGQYLCPSWHPTWPEHPGPPLAAVVLLAAPSNKRPALEPISQAEAAVELLRVSKNLADRPRRGLALLPHLLDGVTCYRLHRNDDLLAASRLLADLV